MTVARFLSLRWKDEGDFLIEAPFPSPIIADPTFLLPEETRDGTWALFAHDAFGIRRYSSEDGSLWRDRGLVQRNAMRAFVRRFENEYVLLFEKYRPFAIPLQLLPRRPRWRSRIMLARSGDLRGWTPPREILKPDFPWAADPRLGESVSNPCLVRDREVWRLWFSASLVTIPDCGFDEPRFIGCAEADRMEGTFRVEPEPRISPVGPAEEAASTNRELGAGSLKVIRLDDGWIGLQNRIFRGSDGRSRSAIFLLRSEDGLDFRPARKEPLVAPSSGWRASHVYACDCRLDEKKGVWVLYYNARDRWQKAGGKERIGRITAIE